MTNDLISQAEALIEKHATSGYIHRDATLLLPKLVEEIKRLRADNDFLHKFVDDPGSTLEAALNAVREQLEVIRKQQAYIDRLEAAYLDIWRITLSDKDGNLMPDQLKELNEAANTMLQLQAQATLEKIRGG
jgi:hypothetical protein